MKNDIKDKKEGPVEMLFPGGSKYEGQIKHGKPCGKGKLTFADGGVYVGDFNDRKPNGYGTLTTVRGELGKWCLKR